MDFLKISVVIAFIILSIVTLKLRPSMHQPMIIEDADFKLTRISDTITTKNIPVTTSSAPKKEVTKIEVEPQQVQTQVQQFLAVPETPRVVTLEQQPERRQVRYIQPKPEEKHVVVNNLPKEPVNRTVQEPEDDSIALLQQVLKGAQQQAEEKKSVNRNHKNPYMTEQEEIIAWNRWRSNLQNQIMKDSNIDYAPYGTIFMFTFIVDKYGNVSNIKVECSNPNFMGLARSRVKPAIANLQRKPILNFPRGTQRTSTVVNGLFIMGSYDRYSTPDDYADYERVRY